MEHFDLDAAVSAGVLRSDQADALRRFDESQRNAPSATEERFALFSGFSDIMAAIGIAMLAWTGIVVQVIAMGVGVVFPLLYWWGATFFTVKRRMMLTSIVLFAGFALSSAMAALSIALWVLGKSPASVSMTDMANIWGTMVATITTGACWLYWRRFRLPIAYCGFAVAAVNVGVNLVRLLIPGMPDWGVDLVNAATGPIFFAWAMWWDITDVRRETIRNDVAFWLHIAAGFTIVKTAMTLLLGSAGSAEGWWRLFSHPATPTAADAASVLALVGIFAVVSLIIDRRSLLTSGMVYAVPALIALIGGGAMMFAAPLFVTGVMLVVLAVQWLPLRTRLLQLLPSGVVAQLPRPQLKAVGPRPVF
jgi:hypothetical protein